MKIKEGASLAGLDIRMRPGLGLIDTVYRKYNQELVITSGLDGAHSARSLHYYGLAVDCRTWFFDKITLNAVVEDLRKVLPRPFQVIVESDHLHIQYNVDLAI